MHWPLAFYVEYIQRTHFVTTRKPLKQNRTKNAIVNPNIQIYAAAKMSSKTVFENVSLGVKVCMFDTGGRAG
jgi:hypothetical protein